MLAQELIVIPTTGPGLYEFTDAVARLVSKSADSPGWVNVFCQHTSASLVIMENADASARRDLVAWFDRTVPEHDSLYTHNAEGPDDMPSHIKMALSRTSETIPFRNGKLLLGTWQGIFLWEHRRQPHRRNLIITFCA